MMLVKTPEQIRKLRKNLGMTQRQFAERLNVSQLAVTHWETGKYFPSKLAQEKLQAEADKKKKKKAPPRSIGIKYYPSGRSYGRPIAQGSTTSLVNARGRVGMHLARFDYFPRAVIYDRFTGRWILKMWRKGGLIHLQENDEDEGG